MCCYLMFDEGDDSSIDSIPLHGSMEQSSAAEHQMVCHLTSADEEEELEEHFPTAPLGDDVWMQEPVPDRHICIHEHSQLHDLCPYPSHEAWINYTSLQNMHQHHSTWT